MLHIKGLDKDISARSVQNYDTKLLDSVQAKLRDIDKKPESQKGTVLVEYYRRSTRDPASQPDGSVNEIAHEYFAAVITKDTVEVRRIELHGGPRFDPANRDSKGRPIPLGEIELAVRRFRDQVEAAEDENPDQVPGNQDLFEQELIAIRKLLIDPLSLKFDNISQFILSPVGDTWLVPFAAVPLADIGKRNDPEPYYLVEKAKVVYQVSARDIVRAVTPAPQRKPLVFTAPAFDASGAVASVRDPLLPIAFLDAGSGAGPVPKDDYLLACNQPGCTICFGGWSNWRFPASPCRAGVPVPYVPMPRQCGPWIPPPTCAVPPVPTPRPGRPGAPGSLNRRSGRQSLGECPLAEGEAFEGLPASFTELGQRITMSFFGRNDTATDLSLAESASFFDDLAATEERARIEFSLSPRALAKGRRSAIAFCTHGFYCSAGPEKDPLMQCGLALAGVNSTLINRRNAFDRRPYDGLLFGAELAEMDLTGYDFAALIACETGVGTISGGSIASLRYAFLKAGVGSVFATIWSVDADETNRIARDIFDKLAKDDLESALHKVMRFEAEKRTVHPYFWAPFTITGWRYQGS